MMMIVEVKVNVEISNITFDDIKQVNQPIRDYLNDMQWVNENELWNMSLICEPREATPSAD